MKSVLNQPGKEASIYPQLVVHKDTGIVLLVRDRQNAFPVYVPLAQNARLGHLWTMLVPENYEPFKGTVTLSNN